MLLTAATLVTAMVAGCGSFKKASAENDRIRARLLELEDENRELAGRAAELDAQLQRVTRDLPGSQEVRDATPHVAAISIDSISHASDTDGDGRVDTLLVYFSPSDARGRFVQMVGDLSIHAATLPPDGDAITLGRISIGPGELRDAYRSTFLGTHYTIEVPIDVTDPGTQTDCTLKVEFVDGYDGRSITSQQVIDLKH
jgi:hypothetical protein